MNDSFFTDAELANLQKIAKEETGELIGKVKAKYEGAGAGSEEWIEAFNRMFHTITGSAGVAALMEMSELAAEGESLTDPETGPPDTSAISRIRKIIGRIEKLLDDSNPES